jgi:hypothetical protein
MDQVDVHIHYILLSKDLFAIYSKEWATIIASRGEQKNDKPRKSKKNNRKNRTMKKID